MFGVFVYLFAAVVSIFASLSFYRAWRRNGSESYWEFAAFFFSLGMGMFLTGISPFFKFPASGLIAEIGDACILGSFAFVMRIFVKFQAMKSLSPNFAYYLVFFMTLANFAVGILFIQNPVLKGNLIYWQFPFVSSLMFGGSGIILTTLMAITLLSNLQNMAKHRMAMFFLGSAFLVGGVGWFLVVNFHSYTELFTAYSLLLVTFFLVLMFVLSLQIDKIGSKD